MLASDPSADLLLDRTSTEANKIPPRSIPSHDAAGNLLDETTTSPAPRLSHSTSRKHRVSKRGPVGPRKILVALDITDESEDALLWCLDHVVRDGDTLCLSTLQVENASWTDFFKLLVGGTKSDKGRNLELEERARVRAQELLEKGSRMVEEHSAEMEEVYKKFLEFAWVGQSAENVEGLKGAADYLTKEKNVQTAVLATTEAIEPQVFILSLLASEKPDLVVIGSREPQLTWAPASEGVVECMARYAPCPVLVHRTHERTPEAHVFDAGVKSASTNVETEDALDGLLAGVKAPVTDVLKERGALDAQTPEESLKVKEKNALSDITGGGMGLTPHERETVEHVKEKGASLYNSAADTLKGTAGAITHKASELYSGAAETISGTGSAITHKASEYYNSAGQVIQDKSASLYTSAAETIKAIPAVISHTASDLYTAAAGTLNKTGEIVSNKSTEAYNATADTLQATGETLQSTGETVANKSSEYASAAADTIKDTASSTYNAAADTSARAYDAAADVTTRAYTTTADTLQATGETVSRKAGEYYEAGKNKAGELVNATAETLQQTGETVANKSSELANAAAETGTHYYNRAAETAADTGRVISEKSTAAYNTAAEKLPEYYNRAAETATETGKNIKNTTMEYANAAAEKSGQMYEQAKQTGSEYATAAADKSSELYDSAKRTATVYGQQAADNYSEMYDSAKRTATEYGNVAAEKSSQMYDTAKRTATEYGNAAADTSSKLMDSAKRTGTEYANAAADTTSQLIDSAKKTGSQVSDKTSDLYSQAKRTGAEMYDQATDKAAQAKDSTKDAFHSIKKSESAEPAHVDAAWKDTHSGAPLGDRAWDIGTAPAGDVGGAGFHWKKGEEPTELGQASVKAKAEMFEGIAGSKISGAAKKSKSDDDEEALELKRAMGMPLPGAKGREERPLGDLAEVFASKEKIWDPKI
ncbi:hypothetical protein HK101_003504 [Irineochytrium annulatum]|nr:hypothetical protein HK101_003504 [Irineochytrium annulatum]